MNAVSLTRVTGLYRRAIDELKSHRFFQDRLSVTILVLNLALGLLTIMVLIVRVRPSGVPVPVHYSSLVGFDKLGAWWHLYYLGFFNLVVILTNTTLAVASFTRSRITSFFLMAGAFVVTIFTLIISLAITAVV